jgi:hypothetical protein
MGALSRSAMWCGVALGLCVASPVRADERLDHRGSLGLSFAGGPLVRSLSNRLPDSGLRAFGDIGLTFSVLGERVELMVLGRITSGETIGSFAAAGIRSTFGYEHLKTFFDLNVAFGFTPAFVVGGRAAVGVQYDFVSVFGVFASVGGVIAGGQGLMLQGEFQLGVQFRSYLFDRS